MQRTWVQSLVQAGPPHCGASRLMSRSYWVLCPGAWAPQEQPPQEGAATAQPEGSPARHRESPWAATRAQGSRWETTEGLLKMKNYCQLQYTVSPPSYLFPPEVARSSIRCLKEKVLVTQLCPAGVGSHSLLLGIFLTQGANPGLLHRRQILYCLLLFGHSIVSDSVTPWTAAHQAFLSFTISQSLLKLVSIESVMPSNHLILCHRLLLLTSIFPSNRVFSKESALRITWPKYWSFSFNISPSNEHPGLISFRMDWLDLLAVQGTPNSILQHHSSKASVLRCSAFFMVWLMSEPLSTVVWVSDLC